MICQLCALQNAVLICKRFSKHCRHYHPKWVFHTLCFSFSTLHGMIAASNDFSLSCYIAHCNRSSSWPTDHHAAFQMAWQRSTRNISSYSILPEIKPQQSSRTHNKLCIYYFIFPYFTSSEIRKFTLSPFSLFHASIKSTALEKGLCVIALQDFGPHILATRVGRLDDWNLKRLQNRKSTEFYFSFRVIYSLFWTLSSNFNHSIRWPYIYTLWTYLPKPRKLINKQMKKWIIIFFGYYIWPLSATNAGLSIVTFPTL